MVEMSNEKELKKLYDEVRPSRIDELELAIRLKGNEFLYPILDEMKNRITQLESRLTRVELMLDVQELPTNVSEIQDTLERVADYLKENKESYPSEIADSLGISIKDVMKALQVLQHRRNVEVVE